MSSGTQGYILVTDLRCITYSYPTSDPEVYLKYSTYIFSQRGMLKYVIWYSRICPRDRFKMYHLLIRSRSLPRSTRYLVRLNFYKMLDIGSGYWIPGVWCVPGTCTSIHTCTWYHTAKLPKENINFRFCSLLEHSFTSTLFRHQSYSTFHIPHFHIPHVPGYRYILSMNTCNNRL